MPTLIKNGKNYSGTSVSLTQAEYDALTETQKNDGTVYFITDSDAVLDASDVAVGSGTVEDSIGSIAVIETSPATSAHAVGTYLVYNGKLYKVTSAISANEQLVVGTNIVATTVGDEIKISTLSSSGSITGVTAWADATVHSVNLSAGAYIVNWGVAYVGDNSNQCNVYGRFNVGSNRVMQTFFPSNSAFFPECYGAYAFETSVSVTVSVHTVSDTTKSSATVNGTLNILKIR